eukprot:UN20305
MSDAKCIQKLAGDPEIAKTTLTVPHPYKDGMAESWIKTHLKDYINKTNIVWGIVDPTICDEKTPIIGCINLAIKKKDQSGEVGYWIT